MSASIGELLSRHRIELRDTRDGEHQTTCPGCSDSRKPQNRRKRCMSVKIDRDGMCFHCHHCGMSGGEFFEGGKRNDRPQAKTSKPSGGGYASLQRGSRSGWR